MITRKLILLIVLSIVLLFLDRLKILTAVKSPLEDLAIPIQKNIYQKISTLGSLPANIRFYVRLGQYTGELRILREKKSELELKVALLSEENSMLRRQLGAPLPASYKFLPAAVIALSNVMELNIGEKDGAAEGMPVVFEDYLIGFLSAVENKRSRVTILTDREIHIPAKTNRGTRGIVTGGASYNILFDKVLQKDALFMEDQVLSSGEGGFPPNLLLGKISHITARDVEVYKSALVEPGIEFSRLTTVFVVSSL